MKVTIDTKHDNYEDIKKILSILTHILEAKEPKVNAPINTDTTDMMDMFNSSNEKEKAPDFSNLVKLAKPPVKNKESFDSKIEFF